MNWNNRLAPQAQGNANRPLSGASLATTEEPIDVQAYQLTGLPSIYILNRLFPKPLDLFAWADLSTMPIKIKCSQCDSKLVAKDALLNTTVHCPKCNAPVLIRDEFESIPEFDDSFVLAKLSPEPNANPWADSMIPKPTTGTLEIAKEKSPLLNTNAKKTPKQTEERYESNHILLTLTIALPIIAAIALTLGFYSLNAVGGAYMFLLMLLLAFSCWIGGILAVLRCISLGEQGFSIIGGLMSTVGILAIPFILTPLLNFAFIPESRPDVTATAGGYWADWSNAMESNSFVLQSAETRDFIPSPVIQLSPAFDVGPFEVRKISNRESLLKCAWSSDGEKVFLLFSQKPMQRELLCCELATGRGKSLLLSNDFAMGIGRNELLLTDRKTQNIYFLDSESFKVNSAARLPKCVQVAASPLCSIALVSKSPDSMRIIDIENRKQVGVFTETYFPEEHWQKKDGRFCTVQEMMMNIEFASNGKKMTCTGGTFDIDGTDLKWSAPPPEEPEYLRGLAGGTIHFDSVEPKWLKEYQIRYTEIGSDDPSLTVYKDLIVEPSLPNSKSLVIHSVSPDEKVIIAQLQELVYIVRLR